MIASHFILPDSLAKLTSRTLLQIATARLELVVQLVSSGLIVYGSSLSLLSNAQLAWMPSLRRKAVSGDADDDAQASRRVFYNFNIA